jgi:hypothetical protein
MTHHTLTLNWGPAGFQPDTDVLPVAIGDTISFQLGTAPPESSFKIIMQNPEFFSQGEVKDSHTKVTVVKAVSTSYKCQLYDAAGNLLSKEDQAGASVRPVDL